MKVQVPIEVILQDPSGPSPVPTPTPTPVPGTDTPCNCDCSTVSVPNTGMQTAADVTNNVSVGLVIVASLIFAVAIGTLMLYLFHLYNHQKAVENKEEEKIKKHESKKAKAHKWSRGLFIASGATAVLAFAAFIGSFIFYSMLQPKGTSATSTPTPNESTYITTSDKITIVANRYEDATILATAVNPILSTTDTTFGYKLYMSMAGSDNKLYLDGDNTSEYYLSPTNSLGLDDNSWGYSLDTVSGNKAMPLEGSEIMIKQNTNVVTDDETDVFYAIRANKDLPYGTYKGEIEYSIEGFSGFPTTLTNMQDMTTAICDAVYTPNAFKADGVTVEDVVPTATLKDTRDNKEYTIAKLADGKCWMTQNLDLQNEGLVQAIDSTNTDNPAAGFTLPDSQTSGEESWYNWEDEETSYNTPHVYDTPETTGSDGVTYTQKELGNLYNWVTATAGTGTYSTGSSEWENASGSICPKGWRLVDQIGQYQGWGVYKGEVKDFSELTGIYDITYNIKETTTGGGGITYSSHNYDRLFSAPINLVRSGYYSDGIYSVGYAGNVWSSRAFGNSNAGGYGFLSNYVSPWGYNNKYHGYSVRCVAR